MFNMTFDMIERANSVRVLAKIHILHLHQLLHPKLNVNSMLIPNDKNYDMLAHVKTRNRRFQKSEFRPGVAPHSST